MLQVDISCAIVYQLFNAQIKKSWSHREPHVCNMRSPKLVLCTSHAV